MVEILRKLIADNTAEINELNEKLSTELEKLIDSVAKAFGASKCGKGAPNILVIKAAADKVNSLHERLKWLHEERAKLKSAIRGIRKGTARKPDSPDSGELTISPVKPIGDGEDEDE